MSLVVIKSPQDIQVVRDLDHQRAANYAKTQTPMTREQWLEQVRVFEQAGRDTESSTPFWKRLLWRLR
jgi:hypothetical protein